MTLKFNLLTQIIFRNVRPLKSYFPSLHGYTFIFNSVYMAVYNAPTNSIHTPVKKASTDKLCNSTSPSSDKILNT